MIGVDNAIAWAHWQIRGGTRRILTSAAFLAAMVTGGIMVNIHLAPGPAAPILRNWVGMILLLQSGLLLFLGATRVSGAVRLDISSKMLESNRLMPIHPLAAIGAYLVGPTCGVIAVAVATFIIGAIASMQSGLPASAWLLANLSVFWTVLLIWIVAMFSAFMTKGGGIALFLPFTFFLMNPTFSILFPQLGLIGAPFFTVFGAVTRGTASLTWPFIVGCGIQLILAIIFYLGAARRYERSDVAPLGMILSICLLALWSIASIISFNNIDELMRPMRSGPGMDMAPKMATTLITGLVLSLIAISDAASEWSRRWFDNAFASLPAPSHLWAPILAVLAGIFVALPATAGFTPPLGKPPLIILLLTIVISSLSFSYFSRFLGAMMLRRRGFFILMYLLVLWLFPLFIDIGLYVATTPDESYQSTSIFAYSPVGTIVQVLNSHDMTPGDFIGPLAFQLLVLLGLIVAFHWIFGRNNRRLIEANPIASQPIAAQPTAAPVVA